MRRHPHLSSSCWFVPRLLALAVVFSLLGPSAVTAAPTLRVLVSTEALERSAATTEVMRHLGQWPDRFETLGPEALERSPPAAPETAPPPLDRTFSRTLEQVRRSYRRLALADCLRALKELENAHRLELSCPGQAPRAAQLSLWMGAVRAAARGAGAKEARAEAREHFATALFLDPGLRIDKVYFPPDLVALFEQVRKDLGARATGTLSLSAQPEGAALFVDGQAAGVAPRSITLPYGQHYLCVRRPGHTDWGSRVAVNAGKVEAQSVYLEPLSREALAARVVARRSEGSKLDLSQPDDAALAAGALAADAVVALSSDGASASLWRPGRELEKVLAGEGPLGAAVEERLAAGTGTPSGKAVPRTEAPLAGPDASVVRPVEAKEPPTVAPERWQLEAGVAAALGLSEARGPSLGLVLGLGVPLGGRFSLGLRGFLARSSASTGLVESSEVGARGDVRGVATANRAAQLEGRYRASISADWSALWSAGVRWENQEWGSLTPMTPEGRNFALSSSSESLVFEHRLGPLVSAGTAVALGPAWELALGLSYSVTFPLALEGYATTRTTASGNVAATLVPTEALHNRLGLQASLAYRF